MPENPPIDLAGGLSAVVVYLHASCNRDLFDSIAVEQLSYSQLLLLERLRGSGGRKPTVAQAAAMMRMSTSAASRSINDLAARRLVTREPEERDGRTKRVAITEDGEAVIVRLHAVRRDHVAKFAAELDEDERQALEQLLAKLLRREEIAACRAA
jgi:DNA-binding MarR family transcriptional regulator